jgi:ribosomal protein S27AE
LFTIAAISAASIYVFLNKASAAGFSGKIFTTTFYGENENHFSSKNAVYLGGGPVHEGADGLPDGTYYFQITGPSGNDLLSTDLAVCRQVVVFAGRIVNAEGGPCQHSTGIPESADGSTPVKMMPFNDTPNPGGNYKAWLIRKTSNTTVAADGIHINFKNADAKQEVFKADSVSCPNCGPTSLLAGRKFYDANSNGLSDQGEVPVEGVQIVIIAGPTPTIVTTNASGIWSTAVPAGSEYQVFEFLPFTGPDGEPGSYWQQTAPAANNEGFQGYVGTATGDQLNLNFGNICFTPDSQGNPAASPSPCPVSDLPPPPPTPTPTPTPCPDCSETAVLSGHKFYDANRNALFDVGEVPVVGVQILVVLTTGDGTTLTFATTDGSGNWSLTVPTGAQYLIGEDQPFTDPELEPNAYWEQTAPLPNDEGFRGYSGTVSEDQGGFNFGNVCFHDGNPSASSTPCTVWYPAPPPTPTPTPTRTPDQ